MKQKKQITIISISLSIVIISTISCLRFLQIKPIQINDTNKAEPKNYTDKELSEQTFERNVSTDKTGTVIESPKAETPKEQLSSTQNSEKQTTIRQTVQKEHVYYPLKTANDPGYASNWIVQKVNAPAAWDISSGNGQTIVAVIDTGFALNHDDLKNNWHQNSGEIGTTTHGDRCWTGSPQNKFTNGCDDDNNGYIDDWRGWNFSIGDNNPQAGRTNPYGAGVAHGTQTSGLVGATGNNNTGIATINWNTKIIPLQVLSDDGPGYTSDVISAIYYAVDNGANVINMSIGGTEFDADLKTATDYAYAHNVVVIAAAGNCGTGAEQGCSEMPAGSMTYPALNDHVISVGATASDDSRASFSSYGPDLDVVAPGSGSINSTTWTPTNSTSLYTSSLYGTSFASPQVASLASLIKSIRPDSSVDDVTALILATTTKTTPMSNSLFLNEYGHGLINASTALSVASSLNSSSTRPQLLQAGGSKSEHSYSISDQLGSGCNVPSGTYCAIWFRNSTGYERYLPYKQTNQQNLAGWSWPGSFLPINTWDIKAIQGDNRSNTYTLGVK